MGIWLPSGSGSWTGSAPAASHRWQRVRKFLLQHLHDLMPEGVGVVELHDAVARPAAVGRGPGIALHRDHLVTAARQPGADEQAGGTQPDDGYSHDDHPVRRTMTTRFDILMML